jgi:hypothetical protein
MNNAERDEEPLTAGPGPENGRGSISSFLFIALMIFMLNNSHSGGEEFLARHQYQDALLSLKQQLSNYTAWLNGTDSNFTMVCRRCCGVDYALTLMFNQARERIRYDIVGIALHGSGRKP